MPELPEVETVREGLSRWITGRTIQSVEVRHPRAVRRHVAGAHDFADRLVGAQIAAVSRRGKYLWMPLAGRDDCIVGHLGMSGQMLVTRADSPDERHLHVRIHFSDDAVQLRFVDQRTFGGVLLDDLVPAADRPQERIPAQIAHIARDPLDPYVDDALFVRRLRKRESAIKRALLDQSLISGIGNIYADESLWRAKLNGERLASRLTRPAIGRLLGHVRDVLRDALRAGGTSFDALYVNANGESGYFDRSLAVYGREGRPCQRCGAAITRVSFMNRSSFYCPRCQPRPRSHANTGNTRRAHVDPPLSQ